MRKVNHQRNPVLAIAPSGTDAQLPCFVVPEKADFVVLPVQIGVAHTVVRVIHRAGVRTRIDSNLQLARVLFRRLGGPLGKQYAARANEHRNRLQRNRNGNLLPARKRRVCPVGIPVAAGRQIAHARIPALRRVAAGRHGSRDGAYQQRVPQQEFVVHVQRLLILRKVKQQPAQHRIVLKRHAHREGVNRR